MKQTISENDSSKKWELAKRRNRRNFYGLAGKYIDAKFNHPESNLLGLGRQPP